MDKFIRCNKCRFCVRHIYWLWGLIKRKSYCKRDYWDCRVRGSYTKFLGSGMKCDQPYQRTFYQSYIEKDVTVSQYDNGLFEYSDKTRKELEQKYEDKHSGQGPGLGSSSKGRLGCK